MWHSMCLRRAWSRLWQPIIAHVRRVMAVQADIVATIGSTDLLSFAGSLPSGASSTWIGAVSANSSGPWLWVDSTPASNLNCGSTYVRALHCCMRGDPVRLWVCVWRRGRWVIIPEISAHTMAYARL